jgi:predicted ester cyclase
MNKMDVIKKLSEYADPAMSAMYLTDDFTSTDAGGNPPLNKVAWLGMGNMLRASVPDLKFAIEDIAEEGDQVKVTGRFTGTFQNDLNLSAMGMGTIPATGRALNFKSTSSVVTFQGDKIKNWHNEGSLSLQDFLKQFSA